MRHSLPIVACLLLVLASCRLEKMDHAGQDGLPGILGIEVNGVDMLESAFLFHEGESLVLISSVGKLDAVTMIGRDSLAASLQLSLINSGKERQEISRIHIQFPLEPQAPEGPEDGIWDFHLSRRDDAYICRLNTSGSSVILLPEEELVLPPIRFFLASLP
jgi:hypothetical protein